jgi:hypothetical protein
MHSSASLSPADKDSETVELGGERLMQATPPGLPTASTISRANDAGEPGVENMLGHAPPSLAASGLDMRGGHPARSE